MSWLMPVPRGPAEAGAATSPSGLRSGRGREGWLDRWKKRLRAAPAEPSRLRRRTASGPRSRRSRAIMARHMLLGSGFPGHPGPRRFPERSRYCIPWQAGAESRCESLQAPAQELLGVIGLAKAPSKGKSKLVTLPRRRRRQRAGPAPSARGAGRWFSASFAENILVLSFLTRPGRRRRGAGRCRP